MSGDVHAYLDLRQLTCKTGRGTKHGRHGQVVAKQNEENKFLGGLNTGMAEEMQGPESRKAQLGWNERSRFPCKHVADKGDYIVWKCNILQTQQVC